MTNELAIKILTGDVLGTSEQTHEAVVMAVKALSFPPAQPVEDARAMCGECDAWNQYKNYPQPGWIPCSERMPEEHEWIGTKKFGTTMSNEVYVTFETPDGERFAKHISFQDGKLSSVDEQRMKVWYKGAKPIAWMPLPEPWKGGQDG